ncbi:alpha/beta hydrolase [Bradyrhizobium sp. KB893862 SZCCT0404]|uniref:alpha/beta hydrolase family protein n=1 Tax=Bradyrhizobium sp. KB893862 SZCCT0404 TaxID=2807672 RepID=UPI001BA49B63|nr:alpha/beta hydrolase [Bradyrhizobium sp. KB893862 SZCCT0404]MBR1179207.1 alpha/beta hydrolase [Bradyrhizobium sp. KB893862 SZCCT0404]
MEGDHWPHGSCDGAGGSLARLRKRASEFFESLSVAELARETHRQLWLSDWLRVAEDYWTSAEFARANGADRIAREAWMCSLTAFEVARNLSCPGDLATGDLADKVELSVRSFSDEADPAIERVELEGFDHAALTGYFLPALRHGPSAPAVICIADENITLASLMSRLLPTSLRRKMSLLLVDAEKSPAPRLLKPQHILQCWMDYLDARPDVDSQRIAIYGEGTGARHASSLALLDRRISAAVCDGALVTPVMRQAAIRWWTGAGQSGHDASAADSPLPPRRIACPLLVVVGDRSMVREQEALDLQASYRQAGADCSVVVPNRIAYPRGEVDNFIAVDDFIFEWLDSKLGAGHRLDPITYL